MKHAKRKKYPYVVVWRCTGQADQIESRHSTIDRARSAAARWNRALDRRHPSSGGVTLLCGYVVLEEEEEVIW